MMQFYNEFGMILTSYSRIPIKHSRTYYSYYKICFRGPIYFDVDNNNDSYMPMEGYSSWLWHFLGIFSYNLSLHTSKPTIRLVWPAKTQISLYIQTVCQGSCYSSLNSLEVKEGTGDQRRLWSDCADAQSDLSLRWSHKSYCRFCRALAQLL